MEVPAVRVPDGFLELPPNPGSYRIDLDKDGLPARLFFQCPCGCGEYPGVEFKPHKPTGWDFAGTLDKPTVTPSIQVIGGCQWHGFLTDGVFRSC